MKHFNKRLVASSISSILLLFIGLISIIAVSLNNNRQVTNKSRASINRFKRYSQQQHQVFKNHNRFRPSHNTAVTSVAPPRRTSSKRPLKVPNNPARRYGLARPYGDYYQASSASSSLNKSGYYYDGDYKTLALIVLVPLALYLALVFLLSFATALNTLQTYLATHNFTFPNVTFGFANGLFPGYGGNRGVVVIPQQQQQQQSSSNNNNNNDNNAAIYFNGDLGFIIINATGRDA